MRPYDHELICADCGASDRCGLVGGFSTPITATGESRVYCDDCKRRRGLQYLFDPRPWNEIEGHSKGTAA